MRDKVATCADAVHGCALFIHYVSNIVSPGMSVSFPVTLVPARLALSWSPGPAHVEEQNTRSATVIVHEILLCTQNLRVQQYLCAQYCNTNPKGNMKVCTHTFGNMMTFLFVN